MARQLTTRFLTYNVAQYEKKNNCSILDSLDIGSLEVNKIVNLIILGNNNISEEDAYAKLDEYLYSDDNHSIISAFLDLIDEMDKDLKILKTCGISTNDIKESFNDMIHDKALTFSEEPEINMAERSEETEYDADDSVKGLEKDNVIKLIQDAEG